MSVLHLDCRTGFAMLPDNSVDAILTDPPYELGFMGKAWDSTGIAYDVAMWREALRVLKPGGHMLSFGGTRTYHRMACAIEDAGFSLRDSMMWVYAQGMPKSANLGDGWQTGLKPAYEPIVVARKPMETWALNNRLLYGTGGLNVGACKIPIDPIADASQMRTMSVSQHDGADGWGMNTTGAKDGVRVLDESGRWPANLIHDGSPSMFPDDKAHYFKQCEWEQGDIDAAVMYYCAKASKRERNMGLDDMPDRVLARSCQAAADAARGVTVDQSAGAFNKARVVKNNHPTVKPLALGRYLARLICPAGGLLVDPFAGSGTFGLSAKLEGFRFIGFDSCGDSVTIANGRMGA